MRIENYRQAAHGDEKIYATFDVDLENGVMYPNIKLRKGKGGKLFVDRPSYLKEEKFDGTKVWGKYPELSKEKLEGFNKAVAQALEPFVKI